jgi:hypothetical protein
MSRRRPLPLRPLLLALASLACACAFDLGEGRDPGTERPNTILTEPVATVGQALNSALPEAPALARDVAMIANGQYTRPALSPFRTSADGRVAMNLKATDGKPAFYLFTPEKLTTPVASNAPGSAMLATTAAASFGVTESSLHRHDNTLGRGSIVNRTLCDPSAGISGPTACGASDCYSLTVISAYSFTASGGKSTIELWGTPISVRVDEPKTATARLGSISAGTPTKGASWALAAFLEPMVASDGHLLVARIPDSQLTWPSASGSVSGSYNIVYAAGDPSAAACDVTQWQQLYPISHAPYDQATNERYGFARYPFRDPEGALVPDGAEFKGSYPWIDRGAKNLFFTSVSAMLFYWSSEQGAIKTRYPASCVAGQNCVNPTTSANISGEEEASHSRGVSVAGLWTHGKMVLLDNLLNNIDYALRIADDEQRMVSLYQPGSGPLGTESGDVRLGSGRFNAITNSSAGWPAGSALNTSFIDSLESLFNHLPHARPQTPRDVVWTVNSGHGSDEVAFDDYLDVDALIVTEMSGSQSFGGGSLPQQMQYHDGFVRKAALTGGGFSDAVQVRVQNAATTPSERWLVPAYGLVSGGARLEPAALGGIRGKGLWLDGSDDAVSYAIAAQPRDIGATAFHASIFLDSRFADDAVSRRLFTFPDGSRIDVVGRHAINYADASGSVVTTVELPASAGLAYKAFSHLGFGVRDAGRRVDLYLDGYLWSTWSSSTQALFRLVPGTFRVGAAAGAAGIRGWIDEVKVILRQLEPELACNHARGTLIGLPSTYGGPWVAVAARYPAEVHAALSARLLASDELTHDQYACFHDYPSELGATLANLPAGTISIRDSVLAPEATLVYGAPRPDTSQNGFCLSCHAEGQPVSLSIEALVPITLPMQDDPRRQPSQPPRLVFGNVPANYVPTTGLPSAPAQAPSSGLSLDQWVFP